MTEEQATDRLGPVVYEDANNRVRINVRTRAIYIHKVVNGCEELPRGYILGGNYAKLHAGAKA